MRKIIIEEKRKISRRTFLKACTSVFFGAAASSALYSLVVERYWVEVKSITISFDRLPIAFSGSKIVHFSDLHMGFFYNKKNLLNLVNRINSLDPDFLCFTGDLVEDNIEELDEYIPILQGLHSKIGKIAILGNHDFRSGQQEKIVDCLRESGFSVLINERIYFEKNGEKIHFAGLDDMLFGKPDIEQSLTGIPRDAFTVMLAHEPDFADTVSQYPVDLQLSGHSHGGQIRVPFVGPLFTPDGAKNYLQGMKKIAGSDMILYTNRGIGTTFLPIRFNCRPEITVFQLKSTKLE